MFHWCFKNVHTAHIDVLAFLLSCIYAVYGAMYGKRAEKYD